MLIGEALEDLKDHCNINRPVVLDIGFGKGGDLPKYRQGRIRHLIATDIAETSLQQARHRYNDMKLYRQFTAEFFPADSTRERIRNKFQQKTMANLVSIQFSFHYCFESLGQVKQMLLNISENLAVGGYFIGTTPDSSELVRRARQVNSTTFGNEIYKVSFKDANILDESKPPPLFGCTYNFTLDEQVVECPEFLVYFPALEEIARQFGLELEYKRPFAEYFLQMKMTDNGLFLLRKLGVFSRYDGHNTTGRPGDFEHADPFLERIRREKEGESNDDSNRRNLSVMTVSRSEWEVITLYVVFKFKKVRHVSFQPPPRDPNLHKKRRV